MATTEEKSQMRLSVPEGVNSIRDTLDQNRYQLVLDLSPEFNRVLEELALRIGTKSRADVINMAVGILKYLSDQVRQGKHVGVASSGQELETEITDI